MCYNLYRCLLQLAPLSGQVVTVTLVGLKLVISIFTFHNVPFLGN